MADQVAKGLSERLAQWVEPVKETLVGSAVSEVVGAGMVDKSGWTETEKFNRIPGNFRRL